MSNGYSNGKIPDSALASIAQGRLIKDNHCAASWNAMNVEARSLGVELLPTGSRSSYRTYQQQVDLYNDYLAGRGALAAKPGTSNHGLGLAVDVATQGMRQMIDRIGRKYGWAKDWSDAPSEWWHLKYRAGVWSGVDPGSSGRPAPPPPPPPIPTYIYYQPGGPIVMIAVMQNKDGRLEVFVEKDDGSVWHKWQESPNTAFTKNWGSLGTPGK